MKSCAAAARADFGRVEQQQMDVLAFENGCGPHFRAGCSKAMSVLPEVGLEEKQQKVSCPLSRGNFAASNSNTNSHGAAACVVSSEEKKVDKRSVTVIISK